MDWDAIIAEIDRRRWQLVIAPTNDMFGDHGTEINVIRGDDGCGEVVQFDENGKPQTGLLLEAARRLCRSLDPSFV